MGTCALASVIGANRPDQSRIITPGTNKDISSRDDVRSTVRNDVGEADKLDATVEGSLWLNLFWQVMGTYAQQV